jgi:pantoate--beta-alanine ligase
MNIIQSPREMQNLVSQWRCEGLSVGFVPTMGALHEGHLALLRAARKQNARVVASIFVNPTQFAPHEDLSRYPRPFERDCEALREVGCDALFAPTPRDIYGDDFAAGEGASARETKTVPHTFVDVSYLGDLWEGAARPGHLRGVATVVAILFNIVRADRAYFGEKDYQQLRVVEQMARDLHCGVEVVGCETVRDADGLALSSRNVYLSPQEREAALCLPRALQKGAAMAQNGARDTAEIAAAMQQICDAQPLVKTQYIAVVDAQTLAPLSQLDERKARALVAARVGNTRLIDNIAL